MIDTTPYREEMLETARALLSVDSPSGYFADVHAYLCTRAEEEGFAFSMTNKGCAIVDIPGREKGKTVCLCAHVDTLGAMVRSVTDDGMLMFTRVGGPILPTLDGEYCRVHTREGKEYTGTILSLSPAAHVFPDSVSRARDDENMAVRIDEQVRSKEDVRALGIAPGDYIFIDPKTEVTQSGFLKSRFIDDKGSAACLLTLLRLLRREKVSPRYDTKLYFSVYEEVGHGGAGIPACDEVLAVDMGCVGLDMSCTEYDVSICAKDSGGPYDYEMVSRLVALAKDHGVSHAVDIYPMYSSDVTVAWRAGHDTRGALIGPGVSASHGMERTHVDGLENTLKLVLLYLEAL